MNKNLIKGKWNQVKGEAKIQWAKLTDDDLDKIEGSYDKMVGKLQEKYGYEREKAQKETQLFFEKHS